VRGRIELVHDCAAARRGEEVERERPAIAALDAGERVLGADDGVLGVDLREELTPIESFAEGEQAPGAVAGELGVAEAR
jgi:hypothetical protein